MPDGSANGSPVFSSLLISYRYVCLVLPLIIQIFVFDGSPAGNHQPVRVVLYPRHVLDKPGSDHRPLHVPGTPLDKLRTVIGELSFMLVKVDGVTHDGTYRRRGNDIGIKSVLIQRLFLFECRPVCHVHRLADRPLDIVVIGRQVEKVLMEELDMCLRLHREVGFQLRTFRQEWDVTVKDVYLFPFFGHKRDTTPEGEPANDHTTAYRRDDRHHGELGLLF